MKENLMDRNIKEFETADEYFYLDGFTRAEKKIFSKFLPKKYPKVLDIGCGCGRTTIELYKEGFDVCGFDTSKSLIEFGKKKFPQLQLEVMNALDIEKKYQENTFDIVLFSYNGLDLLYPEDKRYEVIGQIYKVLKKGGKFIYQSHNDWYLGKPRRKWKFYESCSNFGGSFYQEESGPRNMLLSFYAANPFVQKKVLRKFGFSKISSTGPFPIFNSLNYIFNYAPTYIAQK